MADKSAAVILTAGMVALVQIPYAAPIYAMYAAPLGALALLSVLALTHRAGGPALNIVFAYLILFLVVRVHPGNLVDLGVRPGVEVNTERLVLDRGGILVSAGEKAEYESAVRLLQSHAEGEYAFVGPDSPELYFLSGLANPTGALFEFFHQSSNREAELLDLIEQKGVRVIAINNAPLFSEPFSRGLLGELARQFPESEEAGRFTVRWAP